MATPYRIRTCASIVPALLDPRAERPPTVPELARKVAGRDYDELIAIGHREIAGDFVFLSPTQAVKENTLTDLPLCHLGRDWWAFGRSGSGDLWLLRRRRGGRASEVAFVDHDQGPDARPRPMGITLRQWFQLADLLAQFERASSASAEAAHQLNTLMDSLSEGLSRRFPYRI